MLWGTLAGGWRSGGDARVGAVRGRRRGGKGGGGTGAGGRVGAILLGDGAEERVCVRLLGAQREGDPRRDQAAGLTSCGKPPKRAAAARIGRPTGLRLHPDH